MAGAIVETKELLQTVAAAFVAGVGVTATFSLLIVAVARFADLRREERPMLAVVAGGLAVVSLAVSAAAIVLGIVVMTSE